jgi:hypothetical protein
VFSIPDHFVAGELPIPMFFAIVLPIVAVPCGMKIQHVKASLCINVLLLLRTSLTIWHRSVDNRLGVFHDFVAYAIMSMLCWYCSVPSSEEAQVIVKDLEVGRSADSVLTRKFFPYLPFFESRTINKHGHPRSAQE